MQDFMSLNELRKELLKNSDFKKEYEENKPYYEIAKLIIGVRLKAGLTQKTLAEKIGTTQSRISAWENGKTKGMKIETLNKILDATNNKLILGAKNKDNDDNFAIAV